MFDLRPRHVVRFMPDIGQLAIAVMTLGLALAAARLVLLLAGAREH